MNHGMQQDPQEGRGCMSMIHSKTLADTLFQAATRASMDRATDHQEQIPDPSETHLGPSVTSGGPI